MKCTKIVMVSLIFVSADLVMASLQQNDKPSAHRLASYCQAVEKTRIDYMEELKRVLQTREENGIIQAEQMFEMSNQEIANEFADVIKYLIQ